MNNFLTVEDANTLIYDNQEFMWYEIDTANITTERDYEEVKYDFCKITRETINSNYKYSYEIYVEHSGFGGGVTWENYSTIYNSGYVYNTLVLRSNNPSIRIYLYIGFFGFEGTMYTDKMLLKNKMNLNLEELKSVQRIDIYEPKFPSQSHYITKVLNAGFNLIGSSVSYDNAGYLYVNILKTDFQFSCTQNLQVGKVNKVALGTNAKYKPSGDLVDNYIPKIWVMYNGKEIPVSFDESVNDYVFSLDLSDVNTPKKIRFKVFVETNDALNESITDVVLDSDYELISDYNSLASACGNSGASHIRLGADITLTSSITVTHSIKIIGDDHTLDLNGNGFVLNKDVTFKAENLLFNNGDFAIRQGKNSTVELNTCKFNNCTGFGSCITCDIDYDTLSVDDDFTTILNDCLFTNNTLCIVHSGELTINNCRYHNTDTDYIDSENVAFLYQMDGSASIRNSIFDIDYDTDSLCSNEKNIGFSQALLQCGTTANINGANATTLKQDNNLPFDSNATHIFAKYYYPQLETCIYTSPILGKEDKAVCYCVSNENWIYKQNVQITRASDNTQNEIRKIIWEE